MSRTDDRSGFVGFAEPAELGALWRLGPQPLSVAWANPSRQVHAAGIGVAGEGSGAVQWLSEAPRGMPGPWFGGWAFDAARLWPGFDAERWVLPEVLAWWDGRRAWWAAFGPAGTSEAALRARLGEVREVEPVVRVASARRLVADRAGWTGLVDGALAAMRAGELEKVVGARVIEVVADAPFEERRVLKALEARHPQCWTFLVRGRDGRAFVGATPETLCEASEGALVTEALAGTAANGEGSALLGSDKDLREHLAVVRGITSVLAPFSLHIECAQTPRLKALANVEHLHTPIRARLRAGVDWLEVARALHPTPAVAGTPTQAALEWLRLHEGFSRGWYAGAIGHRGPSGLTLAVGLRSALLNGAHAEVFVGAGLVDGSCPDDEWLETERKARAVLPALGVSDV